MLNIPDTIGIRIDQDTADVVEVGIAAVHDEQAGMSRDGQAYGVVHLEPIAAVKGFLRQEQLYILFQLSFQLGRQPGE